MLQIPKLQFSKRAIRLVLIVGLGASLTAATVRLDMQTSILASSLMWQPNSKYVYFPGIPAVLRPTANSDEREFIVEQYFNTRIKSEQLSPNVRGTWPDLEEFWLNPNPEDQTELRNPFMKVSAPKCDPKASSVTMDGETREIFRCVTRFFVKAFAPTGTIGISMTLKTDQGVVNHTNSVFWIIIPEDQNLGDLPGKNKINTPVTAEMAAATANAIRNLSWDDPEIENNIVQLNLGGNLSLGSGFITRDVSHILPFFSKKLTATTSREDIYVVTAAHLFPISYVQKDGHEFQNNNTLTGVDELNPNEEYTYNIRVKGLLIKDAADLIGQNIESDLAVLRLSDSAKDSLVDLLNYRSVNDIRGLTFAREIAPEAPYLAVGYPAKRNTSDIVKRVGFLSADGYPTEETSNFGPVNKFKIDAPSLLSTSLAEPGMSGGPVLNTAGNVIGIAAERPNAKNLNSLIGIDLTPDQAQLAPPLANREDCLMQFNPFDRLLVIKNHADNCDYGFFGSETLGQIRNLRPLKGDWFVQEVLGFAESDAVKPHAYHQVSGQSLINGTGIINGTAIINGTGIINGTAIISGSVEEINKLFVNGYRLNADSLRNFVPVGVRVLKNPYETSMEEKSYLGHLILGIKRPGTGVDLHSETVDPVSVRKFAIWLHMHPRYQDLIKVD